MLRRLFNKFWCQHSFEKETWYEEYDSYRHERFAVRIYKCSKCGKRIKVDGRNDPYF